MVRLIARSVALDYETADASIAYAVNKGWLIGEGDPPHSVCLSDAGRMPIGLLFGRNAPRRGP
jgi:hypothetical protein